MTVLRTDRDGAALVLTLDGPLRGNSLGLDVITELRAAIEAAAIDPTVHVVTLAAEGKYFCTGAYLLPMMAPGYRDSFAGASAAYAALLATMFRCEIPIVARVQGPAFGGGVGLVLACTFAVGSVQASFGTPEVNFGLFPMMLLPLLSRYLPRRRLQRMVLLDEQIDANEALSLGLLDQVVASRELDDATNAIVAALAKRGRIAVAHGLRAFAAQDGLPAESAWPSLATALDALVATEDSQKAIAQYFARREQKRGAAKSNPDDSGE